MAQYEHDDVKKLEHMIRKIHDKNKLICIFNIIKKHNPKLIVTENDNGIFLKFSNLNTQTYIELEAYLKKIFDRKRLLTEQSESFKSCYTPYSQDDTFCDQKISAKLKFSNKEKTLIKRKLYDKTIKENNDT